MLNFMMEMHSGISVEIGDANFSPHDIFNNFNYRTRRALDPRSNSVFISLFIHFSN